VTRDGLCEIHRSRWNLELCSVNSFTDDGDAELNQIMRTLLADENHGRQLLGTLERQLRALHLVWDAHQIGAVRLPDRIVEAVRLARLGAPAAAPTGVNSKEVVSTQSGPAAVPSSTGRVSRPSVAMRPRSRRGASP